ncbi:MAG TPA: alpha/beta fold hydrolase [Gammaproteobacteria bacterium]|nr:alpha/beta fold hydrolase [Gammaproteobacteria bacterium]
MNTTVLPCVERTVGGEPRFSVIWLHGLGADGHDFEPIVDELGLDGGYRFVFPHAPVRPVTLNGGLPMRAWFDVFSLDRNLREDEAGIRESARAIGALIDAEVLRGVPARRIVLAGFSQGGAMALHVALRETRALAGVLALSCFLPLASALHREKQAANAALPIFMAHGVADPVVPIRFAEASKAVLEAEGYRVEWKTYPMGHSVCAVEIADIAAWLRNRYESSVGA